MSTAGNRTRESLQVTIVSANAETLDGLQAYLRSAGVNAHATRQPRIDLKPASPPHAVIFFPDDFPSDEIFREVARLRRQRPPILIVVVTREPQRFEQTLGRGENSPVPVIVPKPAWGWNILDAIRGPLEAL